MGSHGHQQARYLTQISLPAACSVVLMNGQTIDNSSSVSKFLCKLARS
ncbi:MAG TPA: hypothetical protein V6C98_10125 [Thermosynechococcaceae cyanobacterium]